MQNRKARIMGACPEEPHDRFDIRCIRIADDPGTGRLSAGGVQHRTRRDRSAAAGRAHRSGGGVRPLCPARGHRCAELDPAAHRHPGHRRPYRATSRPASSSVPASALAASSTSATSGPPNASPTTPIGRAIGRGHARSAQQASPSDSRQELSRQRCRSDKPRKGGPRTALERTASSAPHPLDSPAKSRGVA